MAYYTRDKRPEKKPEINLDDPIVETAGYRPAEVQITEMMQAGQRLVDYRKQRYEFKPEEAVPEDYVDPTRSPGFDMADASILEKQTRSRLKEQQEAVKAPPGVPEEKSEEKSEEAQ